jgi:hypothetical protein
VDYTFAVGVLAHDVTLSVDSHTACIDATWKIYGLELATGQKV